MFELSYAYGVAFCQINIHLLEAIGLRIRLILKRIRVILVSVILHKILTKCQIKNKI